MCNLYSHTKGSKAIRDIANAMGGDWLDNAGNLEPQTAIFPDGVAPVLRSMVHGGRELIKMRWGFASSRARQSAPSSITVREQTAEIFGSRP